MITDEIRAALFAACESDYADFTRKLIPNIPPESVIGVRTPKLRELAKELAIKQEIDVFLADLPHRFFEENQLHAFLLSGMKDYESCIRAVEAFLPYVDNWATSDQMSPKVFKKHRPELMEKIKSWLASDKTYTLRFGIGMLMEHFLDDDFQPEQLLLAASVRSDEYYVNMMTAWYFATALTKQYEAALPVIERGLLDAWTHDKAIQKARESYRVPQERKDYLKSLKRREKKERSTYADQV